MDSRSDLGPLAVDAGTVFGFRTAPLFADSEPDTGRYGAFVVLGHDESVVVLGSLGGVWSQMPTLQEVAACKLLRCNRFAFNNTLAVFACEVSDVPGLHELTRIGVTALNPEQQRIAAKYLNGQQVGRSFGSPDGVSNDVEGEWRWAHDREALLHEYELKQQREEQARRAAQERFETRLKGLNFDTLLTEDPFARWDPSPPFPSAEFREAATTRVLAAYRQLQALGAKPRRPAVRKVLRELVQWFAEADERAGGVVDTEEREDIALVLEEAAYAAKQPALVEEFATWMRW